MSQFHKEGLLFLLLLLSFPSSGRPSLYFYLLNSTHHSRLGFLCLYLSSCMDGFAPFREGSSSLYLKVPGTYQLLVIVELTYG